MESAGSSYSDMMPSTVVSYRAPQLFQLSDYTIISEISEIP